MIDLAHAQVEKKAYVFTNLGIRLLMKPASASQ
jgi:hypothetical protein